jgi:maleamate amidohydrolase
MSKSDLDVYSRQGFGADLQPTAPYALLIVDLVNGFNDPKVFGGGNIPAAVERTSGLLAFARDRKWPVAHSRIVYADDGSDRNIFGLKVPGLLRLVEDCHESQIVPSLTPNPGELVVRKTVPSAFFGTNLAPWLAQHGVRTLVVAGAVTSGCVRASVVDAMCHGFRPVVVSDCVGDRAIGPHEANLYDMAQKYAWVAPMSEVLEVIAGQA